MTIIHMLSAILWLGIIALCVWTLVRTFKPAGGWRSRHQHHRLKAEDFIPADYNPSVTNMLLDDELPSPCEQAHINRRLSASRSEEA